MIITSGIKAGWHKDKIKKLYMDNTLRSESSFHRDYKFVKALRSQDSSKVIIC